MSLLYILLPEIIIMIGCPIVMWVYKYILKPVLVDLCKVICVCTDYYDKHHSSYDDDYDDYESNRPLVVEIKQINNSNLFEIRKM